MGVILNTTLNEVKNKEIVQSIKQDVEDQITSSVTPSQSFDIQNYKLPIMLLSGILSGLGVRYWLKNKPYFSTAMSDIKKFNDYKNVKKFVDKVKKFHGNVAENLERVKYFETYPDAVELILKKKKFRSVDTDFKSKRLLLNTLALGAGLGTIEGLKLFFNKGDAQNLN